MAVDIRAIVSCSLGPLISGSIGDSYIQGAGLVQTSGSAEINAVITPAIGTVVTFSYVKNGVTRQVPRKLRVLSSFADPIRRTTTVELGCKLTYLKDLKDRIKWNAFNDPLNEELTSDDADIITIPIHASSIMLKCLSALGIIASSVPLTNQFSIAEFDFSSGYVSVLNDLLVSESYCGYLDFNEVLQVFPLDVQAGVGPVITEADIIDLGPIGVGELPGEAVFVSYSTLILKNTTGGGNEIKTIPPEPVPEDPENPTDEEVEEKQQYDQEYGQLIKAQQEARWEYSSSTGERTIVVLKLKDGPAPQNRPRVITCTYTPFSETFTDYEIVDGQEKIVKQEEISYSITGAEIGNLYTAWDQADISFQLTETILEVTTRVSTTYEYRKNETIVQRTVLEPLAKIIGAMSIPFTYADGSYISELSLSLLPSQRTIVTSETIETEESKLSRTITEYFKLWHQTLQGQQAIAYGRDNFSRALDALNYIDSIVEGGLTYSGSSSTVQRSGGTIPDRPSKADLINNQYAKKETESESKEEGLLEEVPLFPPRSSKKPTYRTEEYSSIEIAVGSAAAQLRIELSLPYAPDDHFIKFRVGGGDRYFAIKSDVRSKANRYGRAQNRLLLGNRNGINLQLSADKIPANPFAPLYVQMNGLTGLYRANGNQWAFSGEGIACSTDALFWAAVGGTGTFWFPVAPGVTTLPTTPPIVDGEMDATTTVLPYNETVVYTAIVKSELNIRKFNYELELLTEVDPLTLNVSVTVSPVRVVSVPSLNIGLTTLAPQISISARVDVPAASVTLVGVAPEVNTGVALIIPTVTSISLAALVPELIGRPRTSVFIPLANVLLTAEAPAVSTGTSVEIPVVTLTLTGLRPGTIGKLDTEAFDLFLLVEDDLLSLRNP